MDEVPPPLSSVARATMAMRGKRTGVIIDLKKTKYSQDDDMEDIEGFFAAATRPPVTQEPPPSSRSKNESANLEETRKKSKMGYKPRFSLSGSEDVDDDKDYQGASPHINKYVSKAIMSKGRVHFSPGDMSRASTAPTTPRTKGPPTPGTRDTPLQHGENDYQSESPPLGSGDFSSPAPEHDLDDLDADVEIARISPDERKRKAEIRVETTPKTPLVNPVTLSTGPLDDEDDLIPPPPPDEPPEGDLVEQSLETKEDDFRNEDDDYDDDNNDKEGTGFQLTGTPGASDDEEQEQVENTRRLNSSMESRLRQQEKDSRTMKRKADDLTPSPSPHDPPKSDLVEHRHKRNRRAAANEGDFRNDGYYDDDNDDKEGAGFQFTGTPGTPFESDDDEQEQVESTRRLQASAESRHRQHQKDFRKQNRKGSDLIPPPSPDEPSERYLVERQHKATRRAASRKGNFRHYDDDDDDNDYGESTSYQSSRTPAAPSESDEEELEQIEKKRQLKANVESRRRPHEKESRKQSLKTTTDMPKAFKPIKNARFVSPQGIQAADRAFEEIPVDAFRQSPDDKTLRRSTRARCKPLAYWKSERIIYGPNDNPEVMGLMPVPVAILQCQPTPYKKIRRNITRARERKRDASSDHDDENPRFDSTKLRKKYKFKDGEMANVWDDIGEGARKTKVVAYSDNVVYKDIIAPNSRKKSESKVVPKGGQTFESQEDESGRYAGYVMGRLLLPPKGIKDAEPVGPCTQAFTVCDCQPGALEVAFASPDGPGSELDPGTATRFLLNPSDMFRVPPSNTYRLENHSATKDACLTWILIQPFHAPDDESMSQASRR